MKYSAEEFSLAGDQFLGQPYSKMDCQTFVENMMRQIGLDMNLKGSNAWYREVRKNGWVGSPEECKKKFGSVPKGALLFIHAFDGGEEKVGYHDGLGNASHIGTKTGRTGADMVRRATEAGASNAGQFNFGDGAIHSSSTREHVATSEFADRTISGGGWNCVGLYKKFSYGEAIDKILDGSSPAPSPDPEPSPEPTPATKTMYVYAENGKPVNMRRKPSKQAALVELVPVGASVIWQKDNGSGWACVKYHGFVGWMMEEFLTEDIPGPTPSPEPEPEPEPGPDIPAGTMSTVWSENGKPVNMRSQPTTSCRLYDSLPVGTEVEIAAYDCATDSKGNHWTQVNHKTRKGWYIMTKFLSFG